MISIKAISAIALTGLGAATVSTDVYLATQQPRAPAAAPVAEMPPPPKVEAPAPAVTAPAPAPPVEIEPVIIYGRKPGPQPKQELVACSDWQSLSSGPVDRGVRTLCLRDVQQ
jgi:hypothetical protein